MIVTLDKCVNNSLMNLQYGEEQYERFLHFAIRGFRDFNQDMGRVICTTSCEMNSYKAIKLPDNFISLITIGQECKEGIRTFAQDGSIPLNPQTRQIESCPQTYDNINELPLSNWGYNYSNYISKFGENFGRLFGYVVKSNGTGYWRINREANEIQLKPTLWNNGKIYLEYIGTVVTVGKETIVNPLVEHLISLYIEWQLVEHNDKSSANAKGNKERLYNLEWDRVAGRMMEWNPQDLKEYSMNGFYMSPSL